MRMAARMPNVAPLRPHDLRHTAVSLGIAAGASPKQIAVWAGHTSVSVVLDRYGTCSPATPTPSSNGSKRWLSAVPTTSPELSARCHGPARGGSMVPFNGT